MQEVKKYTYNGPVMAFEKCIEHRWVASTYAISEKKARSNLAYQYKKQRGQTASTKITLPGKLEVS